MPFGGQNWLPGKIGSNGIEPVSQLRQVAGWHSGVQVMFGMEEHAIGKSNLPAAALRTGQQFRCLAVMMDRPHGKEPGEAFPPLPWPRDASAAPPEPGQSKCRPPRRQCRRAPPQSSGVCGRVPVSRPSRAGEAETAGREARPATRASGQRCLRHRYRPGSGGDGADARFARHACFQACTG